MTAANAAETQDRGFVDLRHRHYVSSQPCIISPALFMSPSVRQIMTNPVAACSGVICSCFRLAASVNYYHASDTTYSVTSLSLWAGAEMTCMFLVACMPAAPKVFRESERVRKVVGALRSWARLPTKDSAPGSASAWPPRPNHHKLELRGDYRKLRDGEGLPLWKSSPM